MKSPSFYQCAGSILRIITAERVAAEDDENHECGRERLDAAVEHEHAGEALYQILRRTDADERNDISREQRGGAACPVPLDCLEIAQEHAKDADGADKHRHAYEAHILIEHGKKREMDGDGVTPRAVKDDLDRGKEHQSEPRDVARAAHAAQHRDIPPVYAQPHQHQRQQRKQQEGHKEGRKLIRHIPGRVSRGNGEGEPLEQRSRHGYLAAADVAEALRQAQNGDAQDNAGQDRIKQRTDAPDEPCPTDYRAREQHTEDDTGDAVAAGGIIRYGSNEGGILLHVAIPMDKAAEEHGEQDRGRVKAEHRRCAALIVPAQ